MIRPLLPIALPIALVATVCVALPACGEDRGDRDGAAAILDAGSGGDAPPPPGVDGAGPMAADARSSDAPLAVRPLAPDGSRCTRPAGEAPREVDLLFVIDNSPTMAGKQRLLAAAMPALVDELQKAPGGLPSLHVGFVTSDVGAGTLISAHCKPGGDRGRLIFRPGCGSDRDGPFVRAGQGASNVTDDLATTLACLSDLGAEGCGYEHHLQAARVALLPASSGGPFDNQGFRRAGAHLALVVLADEDDCSAPPDTDLFTNPEDVPGQLGSVRCALRGHLCDGKPVPAMPFSAPLPSCAADPAGGGKLIPTRELVDAFAKVIGPSGSMSVAVIAGFPHEGPGRYELALSPSSATRDLALGPSCSSARGPAMPALRLQAFAEAFGPAGQTYSICQPDFAAVMKDVGAAIVREATCR